QIFGVSVCVYWSTGGKAQLDAASFGNQLRIRSSKPSK
ncbi:hypothetical protein CCACVL1_24267, partial [Corchorus capsularis]